jgi:DNA-binding transcriptional LysR family regulator
VINWSDFEIIVAIEESKTLSSASRRLKVNQSTISRRLKRIEELLGYKIFSNTGAAYELTEEGRPYLHTGKIMEKSIIELEKFSPEAAVQGTIRISTVEALVGYLLTRIDSFRKDFPRIVIEFNASNENVYLPRRTFDAALRLSREESSKSLLTKKVGEISVSAYQKRNVEKPLQWIGYETSLSKIPEEKWLRSKTKGHKQNLRVSGYVAMEKALELGLGMGLLPHFMADTNPLLQKISGAGSVLTRPLWFVTHPDTRQTPAMQSFSKWLFNQF